MKVFLTGASGYIGGTIAHALLATGHQVIGLVRNQARARQVGAFGIVPVIGELDDTERLGQLAADADAVINAADADHRPAVQAILAGLRGTGKPFIHTSGSGIVADCAGGELNQTIYEDDTPVHPLPAREARVALNTTILSTPATDARAIVIAPSMIYGRGRGVNPNSIQIPRMIEVARKHGMGMYVGKGANTWSNVHVEDLADLYVAALERGATGSFFYVENGECSMLQVSEAISRMLGFGGKTASLTLAQAVAEYGEGPANYSFGSNSRVRALRARRELDWSPSRVALLDDIERGSYVLSPTISV